MRSDATHLRFEPETIAVGLSDSSVGQRCLELGLDPCPSEYNRVMELPRNIGPYRLEGLLGQGGMGVVYDAWDERLQRRVAVKHLRADRSDLSHKKRFQQEARAVARLSHPAIVQIFDVVEDADEIWIVMEKVEGQTLAELLRSGPMEPNRWMRIFREVTGGLVEAHAKGLLHRDLKSENVMIARSGHAKILDFGLVKAFWPGVGGIEDSGDQHLVGTHRAMSPEQVQSRELDPRSDLFALGVLFHETVTGISPFRASTPFETLQSVLNYHPPPVAEQNPLVPDALSQLIDQLLAKDREYRPRSSGEVAQCLARIDQSLARETMVPVSRLDEETWVEGQRTVGQTEDGRSSPMLELLEPSRDRRGWAWARGSTWGMWTAAALAIAVFFVSLNGRRSDERLGRPATWLYVAVSEPVVGIGQDREDVQWASAGVRAAVLRGLISLEGVAPVLSKEEHARTEPRRAAQALAADEMLSTRLDCREKNCQITLQRAAVADGEVLEALTFEAPVDDFELLTTATATYLRRGFSEFEHREGFRELGFRSEDYERYLRLNRAFQHRQQAYESISEELANIRRTSPRFLEVYLLEAEVASQQFFDSREVAHRDHALELVSEAREMAPWDPRPLMAQVSIAFPAELIAEAEEAVEELERLVPGDTRVLRQRSLILEHAGQVEQAVAMMRQAVDRRPSVANFIGLANMQIRQGLVNEMRATLDQLLQRIPGERIGMTLLAQVELMNGSAERAAGLYGDLTAVEGTFGDLSNLGLAQMLLGRFEEAVGSFERALELAPNHAGAHLNYADGLWLSGQQDRAVEQYREVLKRVADDPAAGFWQTLTTQAQALAHLGRPQEAVAAIQQALSSAPNHPQVAFEAALVYTLVGETTSALVNTQRAIDGGVDTRWFSFPWFDEIRQNKEFAALLRDLS